MSEKKTTLPSPWNQDWKTVNAETEKNKWIIDTYLNEQHQGMKRTNISRSKFVYAKIGVSLKNTNRNWAVN